MRTKLSRKLTFSILIVMCASVAIVSTVKLISNRAVVRSEIVDKSETTTTQKANIPWNLYKKEDYKFQLGQYANAIKFSNFKNDLSYKSHAHVGFRLKRANDIIGFKHQYSAKHPDPDKIEYFTLKLIGAKSQNHERLR